MFEYTELLFTYHEPQTKDYTASQYFLTLSTVIAWISTGKFSLVLTIYIFPSASYHMQMVASQQHLLQIVLCVAPYAIYHCQDMELLIGLYPKTVI